MQPLPIVWQRLVSNGETCDRCANPSESNRIWIAGQPLERWLEGSAGSSPCCSVCGDAECRTVELGGETFETIPERLIVKATLLAAAELLDAPTTPTS